VKNRHIFWITVAILILLIFAATILCLGDLGKLSFLKPLAGVIFVLIIPIPFGSFIGFLLNLDIKDKTYLGSLGKQMMMFFTGLSINKVADLANSYKTTINQDLGLNSSVFLSLFVGSFLIMLLLVCWMKNPDWKKTLIEGNTFNDVETKQQGKRKYKIKSIGSSSIVFNSFRKKDYEKLLRTLEGYQKYLEKPPSDASAAEIWLRIMKERYNAAKIEKEREKIEDEVRNFTEEMIKKEILKKSDIEDIWPGLVEEAKNG
jgi:hypothetical protein